jgi:outer membrane protein OmpA-like peptidoglycan-associated protein
MKTILAILFFACSTSFGQEMKEIVKSIYFGGGSYHVDQNQAQQLSDLVNSLNNLEYYEINIMSHTDPIGGRQFNEYLSKMRSQSAINLLKTRYSTRKNKV